MVSEVSGFQAVKDQGSEGSRQQWGEPRALASGAV